ncbi:MAG: putative zinc-binding metallopeptidase [Ilumatobacteraceae bacterium]
MRPSRCENCHRPVSFDAPACPSCGTPLGYLPSQLRLRALVPSATPAVFDVAGPDGPVDLWRCANAAWGCNWMLPAASGTEWCRSCALTRGRPDLERPDAVEAWRAAEAVKRRLVHQLDRIGLPVEARSPEAPAGLAFDLVHVPGEGGVTGHLDGVVTLDLTETDEQHRDDLRRRLDEPFRTVIGHLRHEIAHHYWPRLVGRAGHELDGFRELFGDEREPYAAAMEAHYATDTSDWDHDRYVTAYAASHPMEDWAESFAHYLHVVDAADTAAGYGLTSVAAHPNAPEPMDLGVSDLITVWAPIGAALNAVAESLGRPAVYPFELTGAVVDKLDFVHRRIAAHAIHGVH